MLPLWQRQAYEKKKLSCLKKWTKHEDKKKENDKNVITFTSKSNKVLILSNECLYIGELGVEWIIETITFYHTISHMKLFFTIEMELLS